MTPKEFRELGLLQEVNRLLLHRLGLALTVVQEADGTEHFGDVQVASDPGGFCYEPGVLATEEAHARAARVDALRQSRLVPRLVELGAEVQPLEEVP